MAFIPGLPSVPLISSTTTSLTSTFAPRPFTPSSPAPARLPSLSTVRCTAAVTGTSLAKQFIVDAGALGTVRFVSVGNGAVLETIGRFDYGQTDFAIPGKGEYVTIASADRTFECHLCVSKVAKITLSDEPAKVGGHTLHVVRFVDEEAKIMLSVLLMWAPNEGPGNYLFGAVDEFNKLREKYGAEVAVM